MGKGYQSRRERFRKPRKKVVIVCEGEKTEINYFNGLKTRDSGVDIIPVPGGTHPKHIVKYAEERMNSKWSIDFEEGDCIWCAFDVDENTNQDIKDAHEHAKTKNIQIALSNPCFEIWFLLHYKQIFSQISRQDVVKELKKFISDYIKNQPINHLLKGKQDTAIAHAKKLNQIHQNKKTELISRESNPSTQVFDLIEFIQKITEMNKKG